MTFFLKENLDTAKPPMLSAWGQPRAQAEGDTGLIATNYGCTMRRALVGTKRCLIILGQTPGALRP